MDIFRTMVVPAANVSLARSLASTIDPAGSSNMFVTGLSATGQEPATHYVSTGLIAETFAAPLPLQTWEQQDSGWVLVDSQPGDAALVVEKAAENEMTVTQAEVQALFDASDVTTQEPFVAFERLELKIVQGEM